jgi:hypothetical protein
MALAVKNAPAGVDRAKFTMEIVGCALKTAQLYILRTENPAEYKRWFERQQQAMYVYRGTDGYKVHRKSPVVPGAAEIEIALKLSGGNAYKAARILGCSKTPVRTYIVQERAKGRDIGNRRGHVVEIEVPIDSPRAKKCKRDPKGDPACDEFIRRQMWLDFGIAA